MANWTHKITARGNGFPAKGERIYDAEGNVLVVGDCSPIHTAQWQSNHVYAECEATGEDWFDVEEDEKDELASDAYDVTEEEADEAVTCCVCGEDVSLDDDGVECVATDHGPDYVCGNCDYVSDRVSP